MTDDFFGEPYVDIDEWREGRDPFRYVHGGFDGGGTWPCRHDDVDGSESAVRREVTHTFTKRGTYFPTVRATAHRTGDLRAIYCRVTNLGRARVVVR